MERVVNQNAYQTWFKEFYGASGQNLQNVKVPLASMLLKNARADWVGDQFVAPLRFDVATGLGFRAQGQALPQAGAALRDRALFRAAKAYGVAEYEREVIVQSRNDKGAFAKATVDEAQAVVEGFQMHMIERPLFGSGTGVLGEIDDASITGAGTSVSPWVFDLATSPTAGTTPVGKVRYFAQGARLDLYTAAGVYQMTIKVVSATRNSTTGVVTLSATTVSTGSATSPTDDDLIYWEGNKDNECVGLAQIAPSAAGTLYGLSQTTYPKMKGLYVPISGAIAYDDVNNTVSQLEEECGESPTIGITSHRALAMLKNQAEEAKRYNFAEAKSSGALVGFKGLEIMSDEGAFPLVASQMCPDDEIYLFRKEHMQIVLRQDFGWFDEDGAVLRRKEGFDRYIAEYGGYFQLFCAKPNSVARIKGFSLL